MPIHYDWLRYWLPRAEPLDLSGGFLPDPEGDFDRFRNQALRTLDSLLESPVLVLLGDPGMGKTTALADEAKRLRVAGMMVHHCPLNEYGSEAELDKAVFQNETVLNWAVGDGQLQLLLDSLDECRLSIPKAAQALLRGLDSLPTDWLSLRISCRAADWPESLTGKLQETWGKHLQGAKDEGRTQLVSEYELVPLRKRDVSEAARVRGIDAEAFLDVVHEKDIETFASRPASLRMLFDIWLQDGRLPDQRAGIYERGCDLLAAESSESRHEAGFKGALTPGQRMTLSGRIAAMMQLSGKSSIWRAGDEWRSKEGDLIRRKLLGGQETGDQITFSVDEKALEETLGCGLFTGHGPERMGFGHQSWQEFLAAWYLNRRLRDPKRLLALLHVGEEKRIPPKHAELVAWLAELSPGVFNALLEREPAILLRADIGGVVAEHKAKLLDALLAGSEAQRFNHWDWGLRRHLRKLWQPELEQKLRPWITNNQLNDGTRHLALEIALVCECQSLSGAAADLVLDVHEPKRLRAVAAHLAALDVAQLDRLKPLVLSAQPDGAKDEFHYELSAALLTRLWPEQIGTTALFEQISARSSLNCLGEYQYEPKRLIERFRPEDMLAALAWLENHAPAHDEFAKFDLADAICLRAWAMLREPGMLVAFARVVRRSYLDFWRLFNLRGRRETGIHPFAEDTDKRHLLISEVFSLIKDVDRETPSLLYGDGRLILQEDWTWLLARYTAAESERDKRILVKCLYRLFDWQDQEAVHCIIEAANFEEQAASHPLLDEMTPELGPIWLGSPQEEACRKSHEIHKQFESRRHPPLDPPPAARVAEALARCVTGEPPSWNRLWRELMLPDGAVGYVIDYQPVIDTPGWQRLNADERESVLQCARTWVFDYPISDAEMQREDGKLAYTHIATYLALCFLADLRPDWLEEADESLWRRWLVATVVYPFRHDQNKRVSLLILAQSCYPDAMLELLRAELETEIHAGETWFRALDDLLSIWNNQVADLVRGCLDGDITFAQRKRFLSVLLDRQDATAIRMALDLLSQPSSDELPSSETFELAKLLYVQIPRETLPILWSKTLADDAYGKSLWTYIAGHINVHNSMLKELDALSLADFYRWLEARYPEANDPVHLSDEHCSPTELDDMACLRSATSNALVELGTQDAISALESLSSEFPDKNWLRNALASARAVQRNRAWKGIEPDQLLTYLERADARFVRDGDELMDAVLASLTRLQTLLQGDNPLAPFLWNVDKEDDHSGRPKGEDRLSDFVLQHLRRDLPTAVIDREVQVLNNRESGIGERTDIKIAALAEGLSPIVLIIETKGCWNSELMTSMQRQLKERYLRQLRANHGLYLVGWYACDFWQGQDPKRRRCERAASDPADLQAKLSALAGDHSDSEFRLVAFVLDVHHPV
jgi:hypothetical protein